MAGPTNSRQLPESEPVPAGMTYVDETTPKPYDGFLVYNIYADKYQNKFYFFSKEKTIQEREKRGLSVVGVD